jgi:hypothetical protein
MRALWCLLITKDIFLSSGVVIVRTLGWTSEDGETIGMLTGAHLRPEPGLIVHRSIVVEMASFGFHITRGVRHLIATD